MKERLLSLLACPECAASFTLTVDERDQDEIKLGRLTCANGHLYPIRDFIPRFVASDAYVKNFSLEWTVNRTTQVDSQTRRDDSAVTFREKTGFTRNELAGRMTLDVGVGTGRFAEIALGLGAEVVGIDLSLAVDAAFRNIGRNSKMHLVQADVFHLPFKHEAFDAIYSIGVLHHTPNTREAFRAVLPFLKAGGRIAIWLYDFYSHVPFMLTRLYRKLTTRLPKRLLYALCYIAVPYYYLERIPGLRYLFKVLLFIPEWKDWRWRVLDTFDWYSPTYQWWHTDAEVFRWFEEAGLEKIRVLDLPVAMSGVKPMRVAS